MTSIEAGPIALIIRAPHLESEVNFVRSAWTKSYAHYRPTRCWYVDGRCTKTTQMPLGLYFRAHHEYVDRMMPLVQIACPATNPEVIAGFSCVDGDLLYYCYVASPFRRFGVARTLLAEYTQRHMTMVTWTPILEHLTLPRTWVLNEVSKWA